MGYRGALLLAGGHGQAQENNALQSRDVLNIPCNVCYMANGGIIFVPKQRFLTPIAVSMSVYRNSDVQQKQRLERRMFNQALSPL